MSPTARNLDLIHPSWVRAKARTSLWVIMHGSIYILCQKNKKVFFHEKFLSERLGNITSMSTLSFHYSFKLIRETTSKALI